jgi:hypothetical protein
MVSSVPIESDASFCVVAKPIAWSAHDSDETILQVKEHNAAGSALCGWAGLAGAAGGPVPLMPSK